jgi:hypothetical protein
MTAQTQHIKFSQDAEFANLNQTTGPGSSFSLQVSRNTATAAGTSASLSYLEFDVAQDLSSISFTQIVGQIPSTDFTGQSTQHLVLDFDTAQLDPSTSITQSCTLDLVLFTETCGPAPSGTIHLDFQSNGAQQTRILALEKEDTLGPVTVRTHQHSDNTSANAQGTVFGTSVSSTSAFVGVNRSSTLDIVRN